ncbi:facilitated trehalose transporter Tret1-2 homolog isoform X2 [Diabrotica virgifera virgifera]|uniref:Major facilitator superfamily (MFS) profile domain-containing protein n=1 Tax=Diabrotica virgifera virgifera TaxID=50390 RepID=A0ABM5JMT4_DIAVI|nr:facilitated trehalose transporter Tret1-2 homolog isoform X2 [Diabrotica virgifera virgifera]
MRKVSLGFPSRKIKNKMADSGQAKTFPQYIAALSVCLGAVAAGAVLGWTSNISKDLQKGGLNDLVISDDQLGWIGSFVTLGALLMCFPIGYICDLIGRKWGCLLTLIPFTVGWLLVIFSSSVSVIYVGRFLTGLAGGSFCVAAPIYTAEIAQASIRGALGSYFQLLLTVGILIVYVGGAWMHPKDLAILSAVIPIVFAVVFFFQPETPIYLMKKNRPEEAKKALQRLRGNAYDCDAELKEIQLSFEQGSSEKSFMTVLKTKAAIKACLITFSLMFFQQMSGINAVIFYTGKIFEASGSSLDPAVGTIIVGILQTSATFGSSLIVDKFGRKILLLISIAFMGLSEFVLGLFFTFKERSVLDDDQLKAIGFLPIICLGIYIVMFSVGFGPIPWMISAELMPEEVKSTMVSAAATFNWFLAFIVTKFYVNLKTSIGGDVTFYIFSGICIGGAAFVLFCVPETKGKSVAEVQALLSGDKTAPVSNEKEGIDNPTFDKN